MNRRSNKFLPMRLCKMEQGERSAAFSGSLKIRGRNTVLKSNSDAIYIKEDETQLRIGQVPENDS